MNAKSPPEALRERYALANGLAVLDGTELALTHVGSMAGLSVAFGAATCKLVGLSPAAMEDAVREELAALGLDLTRIEQNVGLASIAYEQLTVLPPRDELGRAVSMEGALAQPIVVTPTYQGALRGTPSVVAPADTPFRGSWLYTTMGSAPAGAQGLRDALDILLAAGQLQPEDDVQVVVVAGDASTYDMALSATCGTLYRQLDYWYVGYDNEAYGNTGMQQSSAAPYAARTVTTAGDAGLTDGTPLGKKDIFEIWRSHTPAYIATVSPRHRSDLAHKFEKAKQLKGPKLFLAFVPCPTGWLYDPAKTQEYARLAVECGLFPLKEAV